MKKMCFFGVALSVMLIACSNEVLINDYSTGDAPLKVKAVMDSKVVTRSFVDNFDAKTIAVFVAGTGYSPSAVSTCAVTSNAVVADPVSAISIGAAATVYGYYPSDAVINSPINASSTIIATVNQNETSFIATGQKDYMYAVQDADVTKAAPDVVLTFKHALTKLSFIVKKGTSYAGSGVLKSVKLISTNVAKKFLSGTGVMAISSGSLSGAFTAVSDLTISNATGVTINESAGSAVNASALVVPILAASIPTEVDIEMTIDDQTYTGTITTPASSWDPGYNYTYTVTVAGGELHVSSVSITAWEAATGGSANVQ